MQMPPSNIEIIARGVSWRDDTVLLCQNIEHGHCYLPGGHVEPGETAADACVREYLEETGLKVEAGPLLLVAELRFSQAGKLKHELNLVFHVEQCDGSTLPPAVRSREKEIDFVWTPRAAIGQSKCKPSAIMEWIERQSCSESSIEWISDEE